MSRHKWYRAKWVTPMRELADQIKQASFSQDAADGFVLDRVRDQFVEARFVEKVDVRQTITDPFGSAVEFDRTEYRQWRFRASNDYPGLELIGSSRGGADLAYRLADLSNHRLTIANIKTDVLRWIDEFSTLYRQSGIIDLMQIGGIEFPDGATGRTIIRGKQDIRHLVRDLLMDKKHQVEKIQFRFGDSYKKSLVLSYTGGAILKMQDEDVVIEQVRKALEIVSNE